MCVPGIGEKDAKASALSVRTIAANIVRSVIVCVGLAVTIMAINKINRWISSKEDDSTQVLPVKWLFFILLFYFVSFVE